MPSPKALPSIETLRLAFHNAVEGVKDPNEDRHDGSMYDVAAGIGAIAWSWQAQKDQDAFQALYFDYSTGQELTDYVLYHDNIERIENTYGEGYIYVIRSDLSAGKGKFWKGTRVRIYRFHTSVEYQISEDVTVSDTDTFAKIPIIATFYGRNSAIDFSNSSGREILFADPLWDNTWTINRLVCLEGTDFEDAEVLKARVRDQRRLNRVGYSDIIRKVCSDAGAANIFLLPSDFGGDSSDHGVNIVYVSDNNYYSSNELRYKILVDLEAKRVLGADLFVAPMTTSALSFNLTLSTWTDPLNLNQYNVKKTAIGYLLDYFNSTSGFSYDLTVMAGIIRKNIPEVVYSVDFTSPTTSNGILVDGAPPQILTKYTLREQDINVVLQGPSS